MGKILSGTVALFAAGGILHFIITAMLAGLLALTYTSLTREKLIASLVFDDVAGQSKVYHAHLYSKDDSKIGDYVIYGDQWRVDAMFVKMKYWAVVFGADSKYALDRIGGRYKNIAEENSNKRKAYKIEGHSLVDYFGWFYDVKYGSSVYKDIKLNTKYKVLKTVTGLMVREEKMGKEKKSWIDKAKSFF